MSGWPIQNEFERFTKGFSLKLLSRSWTGSWTRSDQIRLDWTDLFIPYLNSKMSSRKIKIVSRYVSRVMSTKILMINNDSSRIDFIKDSTAISRSQKYLTLTSSKSSISTSTSLRDTLTNLRTFKSTVQSTVLRVLSPTEGWVNDHLPILWIHLPTLPKWVNLRDTTVQNNLKCKSPKTNKNINKWKMMISLIRVAL